MIKKSMPLVSDSLKSCFLACLFTTAVFADSTISRVVPSCAQQCLSTSIEASYRTVCDDLTNTGCLCTKYDTQGFTLGELGLKCLYTSSSCGQPEAQKSAPVYRICDSTPNAVRPTHTSLSVVGTANAAIFTLSCSSPTANSTTSTTMPTVIIITSDASSKTVASQKQSKSIYVAGVVIGTIALCLSTAALLTCLFCIRKRRRQLGMKGFRDCSLFGSGRATLSASTQKLDDPEKVLGGDSTDVPTTTKAVQETSSCWPKYSRISPPIATQLLPTVPAPVKMKSSSSNLSLRSSTHSRPQLKVQTTQYTNHDPATFQLFSNPLLQHPIQAPPALDSKGKQRAVESRPVTPPKSPLRATKMQYPFPGMRAASVISTTGSTRDRGHHRTASSSVYSDQPSRSDSLVSPSASYDKRSESTRSKSSQKSHRAHGKSRSHGRKKADSVEGQFSAMNNIPTYLEDPHNVVPAPPVPEIQKKSSRSRRSPSKTSKTVQAKLDQRNYHNRWESGTDIETSDYDANNESDCKVSNSGKSAREAFAADESASPIADVRYPKIPRASNSRSATPIIIPRTSVTSNGGLQSLRSADRVSTPAPARKPSKSSLKSTSSGNTPSTSRTTASPKTPKIHQSLVNINPVIVTNTPPRSSASPTPVLNYGEFEQHPLCKRNSAWPKATHQQQYAVQPSGSTVDRKDFAEASYDFF